MRETEYPGLEKVECPCGEKFNMYWNGGELDRHRCKCGRLYYGEQRDPVMVILEPGEKAPNDD